MVELVVGTYLDKADFFGLGVRELKSTPRLTGDVRYLINCRALDLVRGDVHPNPNVKALPAEDVRVQLAKIDAGGLGEGCLYPTPNLLKSLISSDRYQGFPYTRELALGAAQLEFRAFDVRVLDYYRDRRSMECCFNNLRGAISYGSESSGVNNPNEDMVVIERFGVCFTPDGGRGIGVFLRDLHRLTGPQQLHWEKHALEGDYRLHGAGLV